MRQKSKLSLIFSFVLLAGMLLMFGNAASANETPRQVKGIEPLQNSLDQLVKEGVLTKEKSEEVKVYFGKKCEEWKKRHEEMQKLNPEERKARIDKWKNEKKNKKHKCFTNKLVEDKILTQEQAEALKAKLRANYKEQKQKQITAGINNLVTKGVLNQQQADKVLAQLEKARAERKEIIKQTKDMTPEQRYQFIKENKDKFPRPLKQLVKDGVINEEQAKAIKEILPYHKAHKKFR